MISKYPDLFNEEEIYVILEELNITQFAFKMQMVGYQVDWSQLAQPLHKESFDGMFWGQGAVISCLGRLTSTAYWSAMEGENVMYKKIESILVEYYRDKKLKNLLK